MSEPQTNKERLKDITDSIEQGIKDLFESDKYKKYLSTMSRFHRYSVNNTMLIYMQKPDATLVASFNKWRDQFERNVMKGERGIKIIAPTPFKKKVEEQKIDPDTKQPMLDADGKVIIEEKEIQVPMFKPVTVFDVSQTEGRPLPEIASTLVGDVQNYDVFMEALKRSAPVPLSIEAMASTLDGFFSLNEQRIAIREGMSEKQTVCAAVHEIAHSKLHNKDEIGDRYEVVELFGKPALFSDSRIDRDKLPDGVYCYDLRGSDSDPEFPVTLEDNVRVNYAASVITDEPIPLPDSGYINLDDDSLTFTGEMQTVKEFIHSLHPERAKMSRATEEIQAESISYAVCAYYGIDTGENSFGYLATWAKDKDLKELRASLETINKTSSQLITDIDRNYAVIMKERGLDKRPQSIPDPAISIESMNAYGYIDSDMLPLTKERAFELMRDNVAVYMLYTDNTEAMASDFNEAAHHNGIFGIEISEWDKVKEHYAVPENDNIALKQDGMVSYIQGESIKRDNYLKNAEMSAEDDYGMIDGVINNGIKHSFEQPDKHTDKKPSVLAKLHRTDAKQTRPAPIKSAERER